MLNVGLLDGLLGVAGMMTLLVMKWIIPENSLRLAPVSYIYNMYIYIYKLLATFDSRDDPQSVKQTQRVLGGKKSGLTIKNCEKL